LNQDIHQFKADFFKALAHPLRIQILELLVEGDKNVNEIQTLLGSEGSAVSQQLTVLRAKNIVTGTKEGNRVIYTLKDPLIIDLLSVARQIFNNHLVNAINLLDQINSEKVNEEE
jgi:DNA-binding transcriptional ArsR family regulator